MNYRDKFYSKYVSAHLGRLYGKLTINEIKKQFPAWRIYFSGFLPQDKKAKIIDIGCGNGSFVYWLNELGYENAEGIDISEEQIESARNLGIKNINQTNVIDFLNKSANNDFGEYDIIFARDLIEHFNKEEILNLLELIYRVLRKNGILIIQTPNAEGPFSGRYRYWDFTHEISFTESSISQVLAVSGFSEISIYPVRPAIHGLKSFVRFIFWRLFEFVLRFYLLIETGASKGIFTQNLIAVAKK